MAMRMRMRMLMTLANGDGAAQAASAWSGQRATGSWKLHATACFHQCLLAEYYYDGACCFTANCQRPLNFVFCSESVRQCDSLGMGNGGDRGEEGRAGNLPGQPSRKLSWLSPELPLQLLFLLHGVFLHFVCCQPCRIFLLLYLPFPRATPTFFVYFKFLFPLHFLCVSFARFSLTGGLTMKEESCTVLTLYYPRQKKLTTCHSLPSLPTVLHSLGIEQLAT